LGKPVSSNLAIGSARGNGDLMTAALAPGPAERVYSLVACAARQPDVRAVVEANHHDNRWWPLSVADRQVRMAAVGWSTHVSYSMISTYAGVVRHADSLGWGGLTALDDQALAAVVRPLGLINFRPATCARWPGLSATRRRQAPTWPTCPRKN
jgi:hypothetical protein